MQPSLARQLIKKNKNIKATYNANEKPGEVMKATDEDLDLMEKSRKNKYKKPFADQSGVLTTEDKQAMQEMEAMDIKQKEAYDPEKDDAEFDRKYSKQGIEEQLAQMQMKENLESGGKGKRMGETETPKKAISQNEIQPKSENIDTQLSKLKAAYEKNPSRENRMRYQKGMIRYKTLMRLKGK